MESWLWPHGRTGGRKYTCLLLLPGKDLHHRVPDQVDCIRVMMRENSLHSTPTLVIERAPVKQRKANSRDE